MPSLFVNTRKNFLKIEIALFKQCAISTENWSLSLIKDKLFNVTKFILVLPIFRLIQQSLPMIQSVETLEKLKLTWLNILYFYSLNYDENIDLPIYKEFVSNILSVIVDYFEYVKFDSDVHFFCSRPFLATFVQNFHLKF